MATDKEIISRIVMEMGVDPLVNPGIGVGIGSQNAMGRAGMSFGMALPNDTEECEESGFSPDDYIIARELVKQVGGIDRAHELLDNLGDAYEALDLPEDDDDSYNISIIADNTPSDFDFPPGINGLF